jgi:hypothetical protein
MYCFANFEFIALSAVFAVLPLTNEVKFFLGYAYCYRQTNHIRPLLTTAWAQIRGQMPFI